MKGQRFPDCEEFLHLPRGEARGVTWATALMQYHVSRRVSVFWAGLSRSPGPWFYFCCLMLKHLWKATEPLSWQAHLMNRAPLVQRFQVSGAMKGAASESGVFWPSVPRNVLFGDSKQMGDWNRSEVGWGQEPLDWRKWSIPWGTGWGCVLRSITLNWEVILEN